MTATAPNLAIHEDDVRITGDDGSLRVSCRDSDAVERAITILRREGLVVLDDLVDPALLEACRLEIIQRYPDYAKPDPVHYLGTYPGRHTAPLVIDGLLADPAIFAPPPIMDIGHALLSGEKILESFGLLVSLPGCPNQGRHHDGLLFRDTLLDRVLPPFALSIAIPLVPLGETNGTTAFWRGSHRGAHVDGPPDFAPALPVGSALVWDFRTHHSGRGNLSDQPRPVLFAVHSRDWWQEPKTVKANKYRKLLVAKNVHAAFDKAMRVYTCRAEIVD
jgi:Phytanoyl-CoA dioxygenase (PhyH)